MTSTLRVSTLTEDEEVWLRTAADSFHVRDGELFPHIFWPRGDHITITDHVAYQSRRSQGTLYVENRTLFLTLTPGERRPTMSHLLDLILLAFRTIYAVQELELPGTYPAFLREGDI